jgi:hypothetical protein
MGNFSRFIRPGMGRYNVIRSDNNLNESVYSGLMVSGYAPEDQSQGIFVLVNYSETVNYPVKVKTIDNRIPKSVKSYITSANRQITSGLLIYQMQMKLSLFLPDRL